LDVFVAFYKVALVFAISTTLYLTMFVVDLHSTSHYLLWKQIHLALVYVLVEKVLGHQDIYFGGWSFCEEHVSQENAIFAIVSQLLTMIK
jgi:hypothetical protein